MKLVTLFSCILEELEFCAHRPSPSRALVDLRMLTFKDKLAHNIVPEWEEHYVNYSDLKHLVKQIQSRMSFEELDDPLAYCDSSTSERVRLLKTSSTQVHFDQEFLNECEKVDAWYSLQLSACQTKFVRLKDEYADARAAAGPSIEISSSNAMTPTCKDSHSSLPSIVPTEHFNSTCHSIKQSFVALYKSLRMLQNYALLNYTALNKILKKHKRICGHDRFEPEHRVLNFSLHEFAFSHALPVKSCIVELEAFVTAAFFTGDRVLALAELDDGKDTNAVNWQHVVMGVKMGVCMVLALWLLWDDVVVVLLCDTGDKTIAKYILELDPHVTPAFSQVFDDASHLSTVYFVSFLLYMQLEHKVLRDIVLVPLFHVSYFHTFVTNYMTSSTKLNQLLTVIQPVTTFMEPIRRSMWSCFAMENEHLRNTLGFRKELFIPLHFEKQRAKLEDSTDYAYKLVLLAVVVVALSALTIFVGA
ncbi:hypothetical protein B5M09_001011 [Aphanomyces astaci]|uniref:SPX domain-containing protein n=1 Tax=Aphanomyces astaci TaxID=112090 RepID=A0A3R7WG23_APHAT|nr:hypothetical protein B5M09_001011 [Aphanomyces astaci]